MLCLQCLGSDIWMWLCHEVVTHLVWIIAWKFCSINWLVITETCCDSTPLILIYKSSYCLTDSHTHSFGGVRAEGAGERGGMNFFLHTWRRGRVPSLLQSVSHFLQAVACSPLHNAWVKAEGRWEEKRGGELQLPNPGMKAQECAVRRCGGTAAVTHTRRSDSRC